jgi:hypothetical protein
MKNGFDFERIWESKQAFRQRLAAAPIAQKLRMLDELRERALAFRRASSRLPDSLREQASNSSGAP